MQAAKSLVQHTPLKKNADYRAEWVFHTYMFVL